MEKIAEGEGFLKRIFFVGEVLHSELKNYYAAPDIFIYGSKSETQGKCGSIELILFPAPQGTGLVVGNEIKKILKLELIKTKDYRIFSPLSSSKNKGFLFYKHFDNF